ncbi:ATP-binding cassette domain-containing protein [Dyella marensis]|jgi:ABC-2 type transport system ATP-binding protein|uniref:ABC-2 type transport system ATP-binding protein n=1 Tax=Dyella marensis TaxID=500610 RepID=A0A1I1XRU7_9GAMM|nr:MULTISPECIES: ATP-binding cassette domain-containing protein [Dyella]SFE08280.1 ABC-2 type transport system ATP-binding protein [Dyella marensis]
MLAIQTRGLTRRFDGRHGVTDLALEVPAGSVYGFLGPNGAGKTTTIRLLLALLREEAGEIRLFGEPLSWTRRAPLSEVGSMVETPSLYPHLSGRDNLEVTRLLLDGETASIDEALALVGLTADAERRVREYSLGMRQRLGIALALMRRPRLLVLDEPTNGLDPAGIVELRALLLRLAGERGITIFLSSHLLSEVEQIASHVGVLHQGQLLFQGTQESLRRRHGDPLAIRCGDARAVCDSLAHLGEQPQLLDEGTVSVPAPRRADHEINRCLIERGHAIHAFGRRPHSLETLFFELTGQEART